MAFLFPSLAPDAQTPRDLAEGLSRLLNHYYAPCSSHQEEKRRLKSMPINYAAALTEVRRLKKSRPDLPPLPDEEKSPHAGLRALLAWCKNAAEVNPDDQIPTAVVVRDFGVSRATLRREVKAGKLRDYRPAGHAKNAPYRLSRAEVAKKYPRRN